MFSADDQSQAAKLYRGASPPHDGIDLSTAYAAGVSYGHPPERREEFAPGLDKDPSALIQVTAEAEVADAEKAGKVSTSA